ncbi:MAG: tRNA lysidine(34) synthetase TilS, partial [Thermoleophilaceae bacterium]
MTPASVLETARAGGLLAPGEPLLVMLSGGADSVCLLDVAVELGAAATALHVNYGLREEAAEDERHCRAVCAGLGVEISVERVALPRRGNLQALARDTRYEIAERVATGDYAAGHTASDQAETVLYRLAASPGRRALLGMRPRRGRLVRPLLGVTREQTHDHCRERGLEWREDSSNSDPRFARARVRHDLLPALRSLNPAAERVIAETALVLREESELLDSVVESALERLGGGPAVELAALAELPPALSRLTLREPAQRAAGEPLTLSRADTGGILALGGPGG